ncbi:MAG: hypothetical protein LAO79_05750 [Acidobacteriia bacterium]|nr:hypothetical protein [Terriglobia bacterium]
MKLGFIGFGEAGSAIARGFHGVELFSFDIKDDARIRDAAREAQVTLVHGSRELARSAGILTSTVTADQAETAARQTVPFLGAGHFYADLNSVSPALKQRIAALIEPTGARFVEGAIMAPVAKLGHRVPILLGGPDAAEFASLLAPLGMSLDVVSTQVGAAAAIKMFRSILVKGLEALMLECVLAAGPYGAAERVFASLGVRLDQVLSGPSECRFDSAPVRVG